MHINYATHVVLPVCGCLNMYCLPVTWPWEYGLEIFLGLIFSPGNFWGFIGSHSDFSGGFYPLSIIPVTLTLGYPLGTVTAISTPQCNQ